MNEVEKRQFIYPLGGAHCTQMTFSIRNKQIIKPQILFKPLDTKFPTKLTHYFEKFTLLVNGREINNVYAKLIENTCQLHSVDNGYLFFNVNLGRDVLNFEENEKVVLEVTNKEFSSTRSSGIEDIQLTLLNPEFVLKGHPLKNAVLYPIPREKLTLNCFEMSVLENTTLRGKCCFLYLRLPKFNVVLLSVIVHFSRCITSLIPKIPMLCIRDENGNQVRGDRLVAGVGTNMYVEYPGDAFFQNGNCLNFYLDIDVVNDEEPLTITSICNFELSNIQIND